MEAKLCGQVAHRPLKSRAKKGKPRPGAIACTWAGTARHACDNGEQNMSTDFFISDSLCTYRQILNELPLVPDPHVNASLRIEGFTKHHIESLSPCSVPYTLAPTHLMIARSQKPKVKQASRQLLAWPSTRARLCEHADALQGSHNTRYGSYATSHLTDLTDSTTGSLDAEPLDLVLLAQAAHVRPLCRPR